jgi:hypothetical protein
MSNVPFVLGVNASQEETTGCHAASRIRPMGVPAILTRQIQSSGRGHLTVELGVIATRRRP